MMPSLLRVAVFVCGVSSVCAVFESHQTTLAPDSDFALLRGAALRFAHSETAALAAPRAQTYPPSYSDVDTALRRPQLQAAFNSLVSAQRRQNTRVPAVTVPSVPSPPAGPTFFRVATFNLQGFKNYDMKGAYDAQLADITALKADVLMLQEVLIDRVVTKDKFTNALKGIGYTHVHYCDAGARLSNVLASKLPLSDVESVELQDTQTREKRCAVFGKIMLEDKWPGKPASSAGRFPMVAVSVHVDVHDDTGAQRVAELQDLLRAHLSKYLIAADLSTKNVVIGGDFNAMYKHEVAPERWARYLVHDRARTKNAALELDSNTIDTMKNAGWSESFEVMKYAPPPVTAWSGRRVDFLWLSPRFGMHLRWTGVHFTASSDHLPVLMDVKMPARVTYQRKPTGLPGTPAVLVVRPPTDDDHHIGFFLRKGFTSGTKKTFAGYKERCAVVVQDTHASTETFYLLFYSKRKVTPDNIRCSPNVDEFKSFIKFDGGAPSTLTADTAQDWYRERYKANGVQSRNFAAPLTIAASNAAKKSIQMKLAFKTTDGRRLFMRLVGKGTLWGDLIFQRVSQAATTRKDADLRLAMDHLGECAKDKFWNSKSKPLALDWLVDLRDKAKNDVVTHAAGDEAFDARKALVMKARQAFRSVSTINVPTNLGGLFAKSVYMKNTWELPTFLDHGRRIPPPKEMSTTGYSYNSQRADTEAWLFGYHYPDHTFGDAENRPISVSLQVDANTDGPAITYGRTVFYLNERLKAKSTIAQGDLFAVVDKHFHKIDAVLDKQNENCRAYTYGGKSYKSLRPDAQLGRPGDASLYGFGAGMKYIGTQQDPDAAIADIPCFSLLAMITKGQHGKVMYVELNLMSPVKFDDVDKVIVATEQDPLPGPDDDEVKAWVAFGRAHAANIDVCKGRSYKFGTAPTCASLYRCDATQDSRCGPADGWSTSPDKPLP